MLGQIENGWLARIERVGNRLPDPVYLFVLGTLLIIACAELAALLEWQVARTVANNSSQLLHAHSILSSDGIWWWLSTLVKNFIEFPPLGIVLVGMLGIGLAERSGLLPTLDYAGGCCS